jgi:hypothetical protein
MPLTNQVICDGHKRRTGEPCGQVAIKGKTKCRLHGGLSLSGPAHGRYTHGRYAKDMPSQLAQRYLEARENPRLLSLSDDIALAEARLADLLQAVDTGESGATWQALRRSLDAWSVALAGGDLDGMNTHFATMRQLVEQGSAGAGVWQEIQQVWAARCKLVQTEVKTLQGMQQMITVQQNQLMLGAVMQAVVEAVQQYADVPSGRKILMAVSNEMTRLSTLEER